jgi:hypothetical protein
MIRNREVTAQTVVEAHLARIAAVQLTAEQALAEAQAADAD